MPIPYGFQVLKPGYSNLEKFLSWLAEQSDLNGVPPEGTEHYLEALQFLVNGVRERARGSSERVKAELNSHISGRALRYYGYNHKFNKGAFENEFKDKLWEWYKVRDQRVFQQKVLDGPGYLQEPKLFSNNPKLRRVEIKEIAPDGKITVKKYYVVSREEGKETKNYRRDEETRKVAMPDEINGGTAHRVYVNIVNNASLYYVINSRGEIVLNGSNDPTIMYNRHYDGEGGNGGSHQIWNPGRYDGTRGPVRL
jgi:hypothetical protein